VQLGEAELWQCPYAEKGSGGVLILQKRDKRLCRSLFKSTRSYLPAGWTLQILLERDPLETESQMYLVERGRRQYGLLHKTANMLVDLTIFLLFPLTRTLGRTRRRSNPWLMITLEICSGKLTSVDSQQPMTFRAIIRSAPCKWRRLNTRSLGKRLGRLFPNLVMTKCLALMVSLSSSILPSGTSSAWISCIWSRNSVQRRLN